jgi:hypothetical protein
MSGRRYISFLLSALVVISSCKKNLVSSEQPLYVSVIKGDDNIPYTPTETVKELRYKLENKSNKDLYITSIKPSCGCTSYRLSQEVIKPHNSETISFLINSGSQSINKKTQALVTYKVDEREYHYTVFISFKVSRFIQIQPETIDCGVLLAKNGPLKKIFTIRIIDTNYDIANIRPHSSFADIKLIKKSDCSYQYSTTINPSKFKTEYFIDQIKVDYDFNKKIISNAEGPFIQGKILSDITFSPSSIYLGKLNKNEHSNFIIQILKKKNVKKIISAVSTSDVVEIIDSQLFTDSKITFSFKVNKNAPTGAFKSNINTNLMFADGTVSTISIVVIGYINQNI